MRSANRVPVAERAWEIRFTPQAERWYMGLGDRQAEAIAAAFDELQRLGPATRRPAIGLVKGSRHHNMKEARSFAGNLRALLVFDPHRRAVVLLGGDKSGDWNGWYKRMVPLADKLYDKHLRSGGRGERSWPIQRTRPGGKSVGRDR